MSFMWYRVFYRFIDFWPTLPFCCRVRLVLMLGMMEPSIHPRSVFTTTSKSEETMLVNTGPAVTNCERCIKLSTGYIQELGGVEVVKLYEALLSTVCVWGLGDASYQAQYWLYPGTRGSWSCHVLWSTVQYLCVWGLGDGLSCHMYWRYCVRTNGLSNFQM